MREGKILGLGTDIIEIERIREALQRPGFLDKLFTAEEQRAALKYADPATHWAGRFCAKEALSKALGTGFGEQLAWHDLILLNDATGKPCVHLSAHLEERLQGGSLYVSLSHCRLYATAVAIWC